MSKLILECEELILTNKREQPRVTIVAGPEKYIDFDRHFLDIVFRPPLDFTQTIGGLAEIHDPVHTPIQFWHLVKTNPGSGDALSRNSFRSNGLDIGSDGIVHIQRDGMYSMNTQIFYNLGTDDPGIGNGIIMVFIKIEKPGKMFIKTGVTTVDSKFLIRRRPMLSCSSTMFLPAGTKVSIETSHTVPGYLTLTTLGADITAAMLLNVTELMI